MKKYLIATASIALTLTLVFVACTKKNNSNAITPTYKEEANGTGGNPLKNDVTVTGNTTPLTNPASQNSSINTSSGFLYPSCASTGSTSIKAVNGNVDVTVSFASVPTNGTYQVAPSVGSGYCTVVANNAPNQPAGVVWNGKSGTVTVSTTTAGISLILNSVTCVQPTFNFPTVTISGNMSCN